MTNTFEAFEAQFLGFFNISTALNYFKIIVQNHATLSVKEQKLLLDKFGVALKGEETATIRKSIERISLYSAGPSAKSRSVLTEAERQDAVTRLIAFLKAEETQWAPTLVEREIFLFLLTSSLNNDLSYEMSNKRVVKHQLRGMTLQFYAHLQGTNKWDAARYYELLSQLFSELLTNPNVYKFKNQYNLYQHNLHISTEANLLYEKTGLSYNPVLSFQMWLEFVTGQYEDLYYYLATEQLTLLDLDILERKTKRQRLMIVSHSSSINPLDILLQTISQPTLKLRLGEALRDLAPVSKTPKNLLSEERYFTITERQGYDALTCAYINLYSASSDSLRLPQFEFKLVEQKEREISPLYLEWEQQEAHRFRLNEQQGQPYPLFQSSLYFYYYHHQNGVFYCDEVDSYAIRARELLWNSLDKQQSFATLPKNLGEHLSTYSNEQFLQRIPTSLQGMIPSHTPLFTQVSLLIKTKDDMCILSMSASGFDEHSQLNFSAFEPLLRLSTGIDPLVQIKGILLREYRHELDVSALSFLSIGIDGDNYAQQLIYLYELKRPALDLLEASKHSLASTVQNKVAIPLQSQFIFQLMSQFESKPSLTYSLLKLCQEKEPDIISFQCT